MRLLVLLLALFCAACAESSPTFVRQEIPAALLRHVPAPDLSDATDRGVARILIGYDAALGQANSQIAAIAELVGPQ